MRRIMLLVVGVLTLALAVPTVASAHRGHHRGHQARHGHHHKHRHHHKAKRARARHLGARNATDPSAADAGTVDAYADGVLTIRLANGATVSGAVTDRTVIGCLPAVQAPAPTAAAAHDGGWGDGPGGEDQGGDQGDQGGPHGRCGGPAACTTADLVPGAVVHDAVLRLGPDGAEFKLVLLVRQEQTTT